MKNLIGALLFALLFGGQAQAAGSAVANMTASGAIVGTQLLWCPIALTSDLKCTFTQVAAYINSLVSGDCTATGTGTFTCTKTNGTAFSALATQTPGTGVATALGINVGTAGSVVVNGGALGTPSSGVATNLTGTAAGLTAGNVTTNANLTGMVTSVGNAASLGSFTSANLATALTDETGTGANVFGTAPTISSLNMTVAATLAYITGSTQCLQVNTSGAISGTGAVCGGSGSSGANPTATASDTAVNGVATTFMRSDGAPAIQKTSASLFGLVKVDGTTITAAAGVASVNPGCGVSTAGGSVAANASINAQVGTTYTVLSTDCGQLVTLTNASAVAVTLPQATGSFTTGWYSTFINLGAGLVTITPTTSVIDPPLNLTSITLKQGQSVDLISNGTNYISARGRPTNVACADLTNAGALCSTTPGTGVAAAAANNLSAAGGLTSTIASGTSALGTSAIASATCATVVTTAATNTATTDVVTASFNGDPTAVTGYVPLTTGMLTIIVYPTSGNVNFKVCNNSSASITPGAITLNWRVVR